MHKKKLQELKVITTIEAKTTVSVNTIEMHKVKDFIKDYNKKTDQTEKNIQQLYIYQSF